jgi:hypothetical protein
VGLFRHTAEGERRPAFVQCPGCSYDFVTGEGLRNCGWYECPYLPEELKVFCPRCNFNFATGEGDPWCSERPSCEFAKEGYAHARLAKQRFGSRI